MQRVAGQHAGGVLAGPQTLGKFQGQLAVSGRFARPDTEPCRHVLQDFFATAQGAADRPANPGTRFAVRCVLLEEAVERQRVLHLRRRQFQQLGNLHHGLQRHVPQMPVHHVQRRQRDRLRYG